MKPLRSWTIRHSPSESESGGDAFDDCIDLIETVASPLRQIDRTADEHTDQR